MRNVMPCALWFAMFSCFEPTSPPDPSDGATDVAWDGTLYDPPNAEEIEDLGNLSQAMTLGTQESGRARLAAWRYILGQPETYTAPTPAPSSIENPAVPLDLALSDSMGRLEDMTPEDADSLRALLAPFLLETGDEVVDASVDLTADRWCTYGSADDGRVYLRVQVRPECLREDGVIVRDDMGLPVPPHCHPHLLGDLPGQWCSEISVDDALMPQAVSMAETLLESSGRMNEVFRAGMSTDQEQTYVYLLESSPSNWVGGFLYGKAESVATDDWCRVIVTATPPGAPGDADVATLAEAERLTDLDKVKGTLAHELFHCHQFFVGLDAVPSQSWALESTATWAEDVIGDELWPGVDTEHSFGFDFLETPGKTFECRTYDASYAMLHVHDTSEAFFVYDWLKSAQNGQLDDTLPTSIPNFETAWHNVSVATWNGDPLDEPYLNDGRSYPGSSGDAVEPRVIEADTQVTASPLELPALSYHVDVFEPEDDVKRVVLTLPDPSQIPDVQVSLVMEGGSNPGVTLLTGQAEVEICREAVGPCHDKAPSELQDGARFGLVWTNTDIDAPAVVGADWNSFAPRLEGTWLNISTTSTLPSDGSLPTGGVLTIVESTEPDTFVEDLEGVVMGATGETCASSGAPSGIVVSSYDTTANTSATGTLFVNGLTGGASYTCTSFGPSGFPVERSGSTLGVWLLGNEQGPWSPLAWTLDGDMLTLTSSSGPPTWSMILTRQ